MNAERARDFAAAHAIPNAFGSLADAIAWGEFDAAVNSTPDPAHHPTTMQLIAAGKPVFCEKPLALNHADAIEMTEAAEAAGLVNMVNLTYRNASALQTARRMIDDRRDRRGPPRPGQLPAELAHRPPLGRLAHRGALALAPLLPHGSKGVMGDIGVHILDFATFGTGLDITGLSARMKTFDKADGGAIDVYTLDVNDSVAMTVEFSNGALGVVHMSRFATGKLNDLDLLIHGDKGALKIWANHLDSSLETCLGPDIDTQTWTPYALPPSPRNEERFVIALLSGQNGEPDFRHATRIQKLLDLTFTADAEARMMPVG